MSKKNRNLLKPAVISMTISFSLGLALPIDVSKIPNINLSLLSVTNLDISSQPELEFYQETQETIGVSLDSKLTPITKQLELEKKEALKQQQIKEGIIPNQFKGKIIESVSLKTATKKKTVALTFDDGPWPEYTNHILYVLKKYNIKATFFIIGKNAQNYPEQLKQIANDGHVLANHSWSHPYSYQTPQQAAQQIDNTTNIIYQITGIKTSLFRPPGGILNNGLVSYAQQKKYSIIMWSADSQDYRSSKETLLKNLLRETDNGGILLLHDGGGDRWHTLVALPYLIDELHKQNYNFVTVPELLLMAK